MTVIAHALPDADSFHTNPGLPSPKIILTPFLDLVYNQVCIAILEAVG